MLGGEGIDKENKVEQRYFKEKIILMLFHVCLIDLYFYTIIFIMISKISTKILFPRPPFSYFFSQFRQEKDTFGPINVPADRLWGAQTQRSLQNFDIAR